MHGVYGFVEVLVSIYMSSILPLFGQLASSHVKKTIELNRVLKFHDCSFNFISNTIQVRAHHQIRYIFKLYSFFYKTSSNLFTNFLLYLLFSHIL